KRDKTELELALRARESESSLQISQTELALSRLTALRSQLTQLQTINERIEEFLSRFKSSGTISAAEQSGTLIIQLRTMLKQMNETEDTDKIDEEKLTSKEMPEISNNAARDEEE
uniref:CCD18 protein n=1 Tax=Mesocestoides corti TaxID=53468 RepID=A0A5K3FNF0_MESCO